LIIKDNLIRLRSFEYSSINKAIIKIKLLSEEHGILLGGVICLPTKKTKYTLLRSPHVNKQSREQFEIRKHTRLLRIKSSNKEKIISFIEEVKEICPVGVTLKITSGSLKKKTPLELRLKTQDLESLMSSIQ
jgi:small subunit ribosomal protein S10